MIFSGLNNALTEGKDLKMQRNLNSYEDEFDFKKYSTLLEVKKELNEERKNDVNFNDKNDNNIRTSNQSNFLKFNSYKNFHNNEIFHRNLNYELEKNKIKLQKENTFNENNYRQNIKEDFLTKINPNSPKNNDINNEFIDEIEILKNKISQYEASLENTKIQYQKQIDFYVQQLSNYNILITVITNFFKNISKKYIPNYNFNIPNNIIEPNNFIPLNQKDLQDKFDKIEKYISDLNSELNEYKKKENLSLDKNFDLDKNEIDKFITHNNYIKEPISNTIINDNKYSSEKDFIFKNELLSKKVRSKSSSKPRIQPNKKINSNKNLFKNKNSKNEIKLGKRNNSYRGADRNNNNNNNLDIIQYTRKKKKKSKANKDIPIKPNKKNKSKTDMKKIKSINLK